MSSKPASAWLERLGLHRRELRAWALFDWADSAFATTIMVAVMPLYYADVAAVDLPANLRTAYWGYTSSIALLLIALLGPLLGVIADHWGAKKKFLAFFTTLGIVGTALLCYTNQGEWLWASLCFIAGNIGFAASHIFYEALLPNIASPKEIHRVSTAGYAIGYIGGGVLLAINLAWIMMPETFGFADKEMAVKASFLSVSVWWGVFALPLFRHVPEPPTFAPQEKLSFATIAGYTGRRLATTFREIQKYRNAFIFLLSFWAYSDGIGTIIKMATIYGKEVGIGTQDLIGAVLLVQFVGIPATFFIGSLTDRIGPKKGIYLTLYVYTAITIVAYFMSAAWHFWVLAGGIGLVQGGAQALSRSLYASMIPRERAAEFFGFYSFSSKFAGIIGPLLFAGLSQITGEGRQGVLVVIALFVIGMILLTKVDVEEGLQEAQRTAF